MSKKFTSLLCVGLGVIALTSVAALAQSFNIRVAAGIDDVEEYAAAHNMYVDSSDLEMPYENAGMGSEQVIGIRWVAPIPKGVQITKAWVEFTCDEIKDGTLPVNLIIEGQLTPNAPAFTTATSNVTSRPRTKAQVKWAAENWTTVGQKSKTSDISSVIQEIINQPGWAPGNALVLIVRDDKSNASRGIRCADAYEDGAATAPLLHVEISKGPASAPSPADGAADVPYDTVLGWTAGQFAATHDVYLGTVATDVGAASRTDAKGLLASQGQTGTTFDPAGVFAYGQTYYWRVDEVNKAPDNTAIKGGVWSFTTEPYAYPVKPVKATASSSQPGMGPEKTIDNSGMTGDLAAVEPTTMWLTAGVAPNWIQYEFDKVYKLYQLVVWNSNQMIEPFMGFGAKTVKIETSADGTTWKELANVPEFGRGSGLAGYAANTTVNFAGAEAKFVKLTITASWGGIAPQTGLAEARFSYVPVQARLPQPTASAKSVSIDAALTWRPGRGATSHKVFFGTDQAAVAGGTATAKTVTDHSFTPGSLDFGTTYYWRVDEVNAVTYPGDVWSFTTQPYKPVDDFESYTDQAGQEIFTAWIDGYTSNTNGSTVGYMTATGGTFGETKIVHGGTQSLPMAYDNSKSPFFSEAERTFSPTQDWTGNGAQELVVYFRGSAPGFAEKASGSIVMNAIGTDIWNNGDQFRFAYKSLSGDGTMVARVDAIFNSNVWAKGGVMIRQNVQPGSVHAFMPITPGGTSAGNGASFQRRLTANGASSNNDSTSLVAAPYWVKIERKGTSFSGYISPDGKTWTQLGTAQTITMTDPVLIGLAVTSHDAAIATGAEFSNVSTTGNVTGTWQVAEIGAPQPAGNSLEGLYLSVKDSSGKTKVIQHPDAAATASMSWQQWTIPLSEFTSAGVKMSAVKSLTIGVGNKAAPKAGGTGTVYIDDIGYGRPVR